MNKAQKGILILIPTAILASLVFFLVVNVNNSREEALNEAQEVLELQDSRGNDDISSDATSSSSTDAAVEKNTSEDVSEIKVLSVSSDKCRGCGRCVQADPEHFFLVSGKANVISQDNLSSVKLQSAIISCPADAINLG